MATAKDLYHVNSLTQHLELELPSSSDGHTRMPPCEAHGYVFQKPE
jgi:hypothetical protein